MLCQFNIMVMAHLKHSPQMAAYFAKAETVHALAESMPGFLWRQTNESDPVIQDRLGPDHLVNLSAWQSIDALYAFVFHPTHRAIMMAGAQWFQHTGRATSVLWSVDDPLHRPEFDDAIDRLHQLWREGPTEAAFDLSWARQQGLTNATLNLGLE